MVVAEVVAGAAVAEEAVADATVEEEAAATAAEVVVAADTEAAGRLHFLSLDARRQIPVRFPFTV